ncbi:MAG: hypothetical protein EA384_07850 [Spirochaetaceae bacterium]|nr:MAG: hypothetical protein EA384_07850 [Spirochaetaceae bacterium]
MDSKILKAALIGSDASLSRFNPLPRILFHDDFDCGHNGWCELIGNHDGNLDNVRAIMEDLRPPQLSTCTFFDIGTHGAMSGSYALKLATRAKTDHMTQAIKRVTMVERGVVQLETYFAYTAEQQFHAPGSPGAAEWDGNFDPSEATFGEFTVSNDVCEGSNGKRYHCALRYVNSDDSGELVNQWMYKTSVQPSTKMVRSGKVPPNKDYHTINPEDWEPVPFGKQELCYNELPSKINWHYLRWRFDTTLRRNVELQVNSHVMDLRDIPVPTYDHTYVGLPNLLNFCLDVRTRKPVRNFLFFDSILVSVDW